jgi:Ca2+-binding RTX toxin-like protein
MTNYIGTADSDALTGGSGRDALWGRGGSDFLQGGSGADLIYGGDDGDFIFDGLGRDRVNGQDGDDTLVMATNFTGTAASADIGDRVDGGAGVDYVIYLPLVNVAGVLTFGTHPKTVVDFLDSTKNAGLAQGDTLINVEGYVGGRGQDEVYGNNDVNYFRGSLGNDFYAGRGGTDVYIGYNGFPGLVADVIPVTMKLAFGATASSYAAKAGVTVAAGQAVALYEIWIDANKDSIRDVSELTYEADVLDGIEHFVGTAGQDVINGSDANEIFSTGPASGGDNINGGGGFDTLNLDVQYGDSGPVQVDIGAGTLVQGELVSQVVSIEGVEGSRYDDQIIGSAANNTLWGKDGDDSVDGAEGNDRITGDAGIDILFGGTGNDIIDGGADADVIDGGDGFDTASYASALTPVAVSLAKGKGGYAVIDGVPYYPSDSVGDTLVDIEAVIGSLQSDILVGDDLGNVLQGRGGSDKLSGCGGNDIIFGEGDPTSSVPDRTVDPTLDDDFSDDCDCVEEDGADDSGKYDDDIAGGDGNDTLYGQLGNDEVCGGNGNDVMSGGTGKDVMDGGAGDDTIDGNEGSDVIKAGAGNDTISGGAGFDIIYGGLGTDTVTYAASTEAVRVDLTQFWRNSGGDAASDYISEILNGIGSGEDISNVLQGTLFVQLLQLLDPTATATSFTLGIPDVLIGVENITGSAFDDDITGNALANVLTGGAGRDVIDGRAGNDAVNGGDGADTLNGGDGNDTILGGVAIDVIDGGAGADTIRSQEGSDTVTGGAGADRFVFDVLIGSGNVDKITDFSVVDDTIILDKAIFTTLTAGNLPTAAFVIGTAAGDADDRIVYNSANGALFYDADGNGAGAAVQFATLSAGLALTAADFVVI